VVSLILATYPQNNVTPQHTVANFYNNNFEEVKVKGSLYRPEQALRTVGGSGFQNSQTCVRLSAQRIGRLYPPKIFLVLISVKGSVGPRAMLRPEGLNQ